MKQSRIIGIILAVANVILIVVCTVLFFRTDRTEPKIEFQASEIVYREGMDNKGLLEGITAYDSKDGDVTDRIVIEKVIDNREDNTVVIFYAVSDRAGNVAKASRVFNAVFTEKSSDEQEMDDVTDQLLEAGITAEFSDEGILNAPTEEPTQAPTQRPTPEPERTPEPTSTPESEPEPTPRPRPTVDPAVPVLSLKVSEVTVSAGQGPAWVDVIGTLKDDKDDYTTLFRNLSVSKYDKDKAGTYQVTVSTEDTDGNKSAAVPLTIVVK